MIIPKSTIANLGIKMLPFSDAASSGLPLSQLLRLSLFQVTVGMASVLLLGTMNRVMIVELSIAASLVAAMIALPVLIAPFRAFLGFKSDTYRSALGWKRIPYLWFGSLWQFGGLAIMPFALVVMTGENAIDAPFVGEVCAALAFLFTGLGLHMTQTAGIALAADRAEEDKRPRVVALLYVTFLIGMAISAIIVGALLRDFSELRLIQVIQGCAAVTLILNLIALWKQERLKPMSKEERAAPKPTFSDAWADYTKGGQAGRLLAVVFFGGLAFNMQDVLLEPYGGEILGLSVSATTFLTAFWATGALIGFGFAAKWLTRGIDPFRMAGRGILVGIGAFSAVILAAPLHLDPLFFAGAFAIGLGLGLFSVATLTAAMDMPRGDTVGGGLALGAWGAAQATAAGVATALGGGIRDVVQTIASTGSLGAAFNTPEIGYSVVYHLEIGLLFVTLILLGPLVRTRIVKIDQTRNRKIGLADFPT